MCIPLMSIKLKKKKASLPYIFVHPVFPLFPKSGAIFLTFFPTLEQKGPNKKSIRGIFWSQSNESVKSRFTLVENSPRSSIGRLSLSISARHFCILIWQIVRTQCDRDHYGFRVPRLRPGICTGSTTPSSSCGKRITKNLT